MKSIYKIVLLALGVYTYAFSQITEITRLPVQDISQSIKESTPVWVSENEIMIFYVNQTKDTIFSTKSTNRGLSWVAPKFQFKVELLQQTQGLIYPAALKTKSGRLIFVYSVINEGINLTYSDDNGSSWAPIQIILGTGAFPGYDKRLHNIKLSELDDESLVICFNPDDDQGTLYYKISIDKGESWSDVSKKILSNGSYRFYDHTIISATPASLMCLFRFQKAVSSFTHVYARYSYDNGITWGDTINLSGYRNSEFLPRVSKDKQGIIWISYLRTELITFPFNSNFTVSDIFYMKSSDNGLTWSGESQLNHFIGDDNYLSLTISGSAPFLTYSTVKFLEKYQIGYGILGETSETFTPPYLFDCFSYWSNIPDSTLIWAYVKDDDEVKSVKLFFEDSTQVFQLFDDGLHGDRDVGDGVFGNKLPYDIVQTGNFFYSKANKLKVPFSNIGLVAAIYIQDTLNTTFTLSDLENNVLVRNREISIDLNSSGRYDEGSFLFSAGFFLSGYSNGTLWTNAVASSSLIADYLAGTVNSNPNDPIFDFYVINRDDIPFGAEWQRWKDAVSLGAEFYDGDGDGFYNPADKNWNGTWDPTEDIPMLLGDITAWCVYNDGVPRSQRRWNTVDPQGIEIRQTIFASNQSGLENVIFIRYSIMNTGTVSEVQDSVYFGVWEDADVGDATDDVVGCDTLLNSGFYYQNTADWIYGENPPSFFSSLLQGPIINTNNPSDTAYNYLGELIGVEQIPRATNLNMTSHIFNIGGDPDLGDPNSAVEARNYLEGQTRIGRYPDPCTFPYAEVRGGVDCHQVDEHFWLSGDPVNNIGWISRMHVDHRNLVSTGPFQLEKDKPQEIIISYIIGRGSDPINSVTVARENVLRAILEYQSNFASMTYSPPPASNPVTTYILYQNYPNPFNPTTTIRYELPQDGIVTIEVFDILGQKVKTILNEYKRADRYEVTFNSAQLASGVYIYQLRVNDFITSKKMVILK